MQPERTIVGAAERVDLPEWGVRLRAKIDTGAKTSALHVDNVEELPGERVRFSIVTSRRTRARRVVVIASIVRRAIIRSSTGHPEERIIVSTTLAIGGVEKAIEVSLTSRHQMVFRMLLGREALAHEFLVDPGRRYVHGRPPRRDEKSPVRKPARTRRANGLRTRTKRATEPGAARPRKPKSSSRTRRRSESP